MGCRMDEQQNGFVFPEKNEQKWIGMVNYRRENEEQKEQKKQKKIELKDIKECDYVLPESRFTQELPRMIPEVQEHKMLKYWEKHIIPKI